MYDNNNNNIIIIDISKKNDAVKKKLNKKNVHQPGFVHQTSHSTVLHFNLNTTPATII